MKKIILSFVAVLLSVCVGAQVENSATEIIDYRSQDGKIVVEAMVNGVIGNFLLDMAGHNALLPEAVTKYKIDTTVKTPFTGFNTFQYKKVTTGDVFTATNVSIGNNVFREDVKFFVLKDKEPYLRELGVDGVLNSLIFHNVILTIDTKRKKITTTSPYRPQYMKLDHRTSMGNVASNGISLTIDIDNTPINVILDTWSSNVVTLNRADFDRLSSGKIASTDAKVGIGYEKERLAEKQYKGNVLFVKSNIEGSSIACNSDIQHSVVGLGLFDNGILSIDFRKEKIYYQPHGLVEINDDLIKPQEIVIESGKLNSIHKDYFIANIYDYKKGGAFVSKSDKPIIIDFWATWCGPCMRLIPQMEALAAKYKDQIVFLKVNADKEKELCGAFGIIALPTLFFIPAEGEPIITVGDTPQEYERIITTELLKK